MRIGMLVDMYKPHISGITNYVSLNKRWLEAQGHKVFVFTFGDQDYEDDELYVMRSPGLPFNVNDTGFHISFRYTTVSERKLRTMDMIHVHHPFLSGPLALRYCKPIGIPIVFTNHTRLDLYNQYYMPSYLPDALGETFLKAYLPGFCQQCDLVIAPSAGICTVMRDLGVTAPIKVIPNGIDFTPYETPAPLTRAEAGLPEGKTLLMYVGRLSPEKNLSFLLRAFFGVAAVRPEADLVIVGGGPELEDLRDLANGAGFGGRIHFLGKVLPEKVPSLLKLADVFVTASQTEVHPFSLIEAMASGVPALGIESPGISDSLTDDVDGSLSSPDLAVFTAKLMRLVIEPETRARMGVAARQNARRFEIDRTGQAMLTEYIRIEAAHLNRLTYWQRFQQWWSRPLLGSEE